MLQRIHFSVVKISGEEEDYPAAELNTQRPTVKGWHSPKFCSYPQLIVIRLQARSRICKFQLLSHQYLISKIVELFVGDVPKGSPEVPQNVVWEKQGEISLSDNHHTNYSARELRSADLDVVAKFLKFVLHQNHINRLNLCNQVGVVGINVIGEIVLEGGSKKAKYLSDQDLSVIRFDSTIPPTDDLSFTMYVDPEVGQLLRVLYKKKQQAVSADRFVYAKKLKHAISVLRKLGEKLGKLDIEKQQAIEDEDYDKAHVKKDQMEALRLREYERLRLPELMEMKGYNPDEDNSGPKSPKIPKTAPTETHVPMISNYVSSEDAVLPTQKKGTKSQPSVFAGGDASTTNNLTGKMSEKDMREASLPIDVFGLPVVEKLYSKTFSHREESLKEVLMYLESYKENEKIHSSGDVIKATAFMVCRGLKDVQSVFTIALNVLRYCHKPFAGSQNVPKPDMMYLTERCMPEIINKLGDTAPRVKTMAKEYLVDVANYQDIENLQIIPHYYLEPVQHLLNTRLAQARCELIGTLVKEHPPWEQNLFPLNKLMPFLVDALQHPSSSVRRIAEQIIIYLYEQQGNVIKKYLPSSSDGRRKNILYRRLFNTFDRLDKQRKQHGISEQRKNHKNVVKNKVENSTFVNSVEKGLHNENDDISFSKTCIFCDERSASFTSEGLDVHYDRFCPMLIHCSNCKQVVEISGLSEHLLEECDAKRQYKQCPICLEAVPLLNFEDHTRIRSCKMAKSSDEANHCPLCHNNIASGEQGWKSHLIKEAGCPFNPRRKRNQKSRKKGILSKKEKSVAQ